MKEFVSRLKVIIAVAVVLLLGTFSAVRLMKIQVVGNDEIIQSAIKSSDNTFSYTKTIQPTRGEIVDLNGNPIICNATGNNVVLEKAFFPEDNTEGNRILIEVYRILKKHGIEFNDSLPISKTQPYVFLPDSDEEAAELKKLIALNVYATAENCIDKLIDDYEIALSYTDEEKRIIAGLRYELIAKDFAYSTDFIFAEDIDNDTLLELKEKSTVLRGVNVAEAAIRNIAQGDVIPHEIGTVGPIYAEEYEELKQKGYALNDVVGKSGLESAMEDTLRGSKGKEKVTIADGAVIDEKVTVPAVEGKTLKLTINSGYQRELQNILVNFINNFPSINKNPVMCANTCTASRCYLRVAGTTR